MANGMEMGEVLPYRPGRTVLLALDPSMTSTGFAVFRGTKLIKAGHFPTSSDDAEPMRVWTVFEEVSLLIEECGIEQVAMEQFTAFYTSSRKAKQVANGSVGPVAQSVAAGSRSGRHDRARPNPRSMFLLKAAQTAAQAAVLAAGLPLVLYKVSEWKGGKRVSKKAIIERAQQIYGVKTRNDNVCDAIMIGHHHVYHGRLIPGRAVSVTAERRARVLSPFAERASNAADASDQQEVA